jgi:hypothetical protein
MWPNINITLENLEYYNNTLFSISDNAINATNESMSIIV